MKFVEGKPPEREHNIQKHTDFPCNTGPHCHCVVLPQNSCLHPCIGSSVNNGTSAGRPPQQDTNSKMAFPPRPERLNNTHNYLGVDSSVFYHFCPAGDKADQLSFNNR